MVALVKSAAAQKPVDLSELRGDGQVPRPAEKLVEDLGAVVRLMEDLEEDFASCDETMMRHAPKLQNMDLAMQTLRAVAEELAGGTNPTVDAARLNNLRTACVQALGSESTA